MGRTSSAWKPLALLVAVAAACTDDPQRVGDVVARPSAETVELAPPPESAAPVPAASPVAPAAPVARVPAARRKAARPPLAAAAPPVSIEKLLQVPPNAIARPTEPDINELLLLAISPDQAAASADDATKNPSNVHVDLDLRTDTPVARPDLKREQVDAAAAIDVGNDTSIKGGVRIQRDSNGGIESNRNTTPTIGIEKRF